MKMIAKILENLKSIISIVLPILVILLVIRNCENRKEYEVFKESADSTFRLNNARLKIEKDRVYEGDLIIVENSKKIQRLIDSLDYYKEVKTSTRVIVETKIDTVKIIFDKPIYIEKDGGDYLNVPLEFSKTTPWYAINGRVTKRGIFFDSLSYVNDFTITSGLEDNGSFFKNAFKRNKMIVTLRDNNPYSETKTLHHTVVNDRVKRIHIGPQAGVFLIQGRLTPTVGIGVTYSLIRF